MISAMRSGVGGNASLCVRRSFSPSGVHSMTTSVYCHCGNLQRCSATADLVRAAVVSGCPSSLGSALSHCAYGDGSGSGGGSRRGRERSCGGDAAGGVCGGMGTVPKTSDWPPPTPARRRRILHRIARRFISATARAYRYRSGSPTEALPDATLAVRAAKSSGGASAIHTWVRPAASRCAVGCTRHAC